MRNLIGVQFLARQTITLQSIMSLTRETGHRPLPPSVASMTVRGRPCLGGRIGETKEELQMTIMTKKMEKKDKAIQGREQECSSQAHANPLVFFIQRLGGGPGVHLEFGS